MDKAVMLNQQMQELFGNSRIAEPALWLTSVAIGVSLSKFLYDSMEANSSQWKVYRSLSRNQQIEWNNRFISTGHAALVSALAGYLLIFSDFFSDSAPYGPVVFRSTIFSQAILGVSIGYFLADLAMILWFYPVLGGMVYVVHHLLSMVPLAVALHSGYAHIYLYLVLFSEFTTPFINLRWYLSTAGLSRTNAYIINGILLFFGWMVWRVLLFVYFFVHLYQHYDQVKQLHDVGFYLLFTSPPLLAVMNLFWFQKIALGLVKAFKKKQKGGL